MYKNLYTNFGSKSFKNKTLNTIDVTGSAYLDNSKILQHAKVAGELSAFNSVIKNFNIDGSAYLNNTSSSGEGVVNGSFKAHDCNLNKLTIASENTILKDTIVKSVYISEVKNNSNKKQSLHLQGNTIVTGDITFEADNGKVIMDATSKIHGKVKNANVCQAQTSQSQQNYHSKNI